MNKLLLFALLFCSFSAQSAAVDTLRVSSPDRKLLVKVWMSDKVYYVIQYQNKNITGTSVVDLIPLNHNALSEQNRITAHKLNHGNSQIIVPVPERRKIITDCYEELKSYF